jgi:hypothetical protein
VDPDLDVRARAQALVHALEQREVADRGVHGVRAAHVHLEALGPARAHLPVVGALALATSVRLRVAAHLAQRHDDAVAEVDEVLRLQPPVVPAELVHPHEDLLARMEGELDRARRLEPLDLRRKHALEGPGAFSLERLVGASQKRHVRLALGQRFSWCIMVFGGPAPGTATRVNRTRRAERLPVARHARPRGR